MNTENTTGTRSEDEQAGDPRPVSDGRLPVNDGPSPVQDGRQPGDDPRRPLDDARRPGESDLPGTPEHWRTLGELRAEDDRDQDFDADEADPVVVRRQIKLDVAICFIWDRFFDLEIFPARPEGMRPAGLSDADRARAARKYRSLAEGSKPLPALRPTRYAWE